LYELDASEHSPIIGYAFDGFPIYGSFGFANTNGTGGIARIESSYQLRSMVDRTTLPDGTVLSPGQYGPNISTAYPLGFFIEDYEFVSNSGDLDIHNGRIANTPEYPNGIYAYYATANSDLSAAYPYFIGPTYYGDVATDNFSTPGPGGGTTNVTVSGQVEEWDGNIPTGIATDALNSSLFSVYPNPVSDYLILNCEKGKDSQITILDGFGKKVNEFETHSTGSQIINVSDLVSGVYFIQMRTEGQVYNNKFVKL
jgi:hypothetical protein